MSRGGSNLVALGGQPAKRYAEGIVSAAGAVNAFDAAAKADLSAFLVDCYNAGVRPDTLMLLDSRWNPASGSNIRTIIGPDATFRGSITAEADGFDYSNASNPMIEFTNGLPKTEHPLTSASIFVVGRYDLAGDGTGATWQFLGGSRGVSGERGIELAINYSSYRGAAAGALGLVGTANGVSGNGWSTADPMPVGVATFYCGSFDASEEKRFRLWHGATFSTENGTGAPTEIWNNGSKWTVGQTHETAGYNGFGDLDGKISMFMVADSMHSPDRYAPVVCSAVRNGIATFDTDILWLAFGDSITLGSVSVADDADIWTQMNNTTAGGHFQGRMMFANYGVAGELTPNIISIIEGSTAGAWLNNATTGFAGKIATIFTGHNDSAYKNGNAVSQAPLIARILDGVQLLKAKGFAPVVICPLSNLTQNLSSQDLFRESLRSLCVDEGCVFIDTHADSDLYDHTSGFYSDTIHPSATGYERIAELLAGAVEVDGSPATP